MSVCPHCGNKVGPRPEPPWWKYDRGNTASLGRGSFILIVLAVAMASAPSSQSLSALRQEVQALNGKIDGLSKAIDKLSPPPKPGDLAKP